MIRIQNLGTRLIKGILISFGKYLCPFCLQEVERRLGSGEKCKSCGCNNKGNLKHGEVNTKLYNIWVSMRKRCFYPKTNGYKNYGGRGITVCNEWLKFIPFRNWAIQNEYKEGLQINRINNNGNYEPNNCNFVTAKENARTTRNNKLTLIISNEIRSFYINRIYTRKQLAEKYNVSKSLIDQIINNKIWV